MKQIHKLYDEYLLAWDAAEDRAGSDDLGYDDVRARDASQRATAGLVKGGIPGTGLIQEAIEILNKIAPQH